VLKILETCVHLSISVSHTCMHVHMHTVHAPLAYIQLNPQSSYLSEDYHAPVFPHGVYFSLAD